LKKIYEMNTSHSKVEFKSLARILLEHRLSKIQRLALGSSILQMLTADPPNVSGAQETAPLYPDANRATDITSRRALFAKSKSGSS
jgi:hypothetical protein